MRFRNLPLGKKLGFGFGAVLLIISISSAFTIWQTRTLAEVERLNSDSDAAVDLIDQALTDSTKMRAEGYKFVILGNDADLTRYDAASKKYDKDLIDLKGVLAKDAPQFLERLDHTKAVAQSYLDGYLAKQVRLAADGTTRAQAIASIGSKDALAARQAFEATFDTFRTDVNVWADFYTVEGDRSISQTEWAVIIAGASSVVVGALMAWLIARTVGGPIQAMTTTMRALSSGDNSVAVPARDQTDEIGQMAGAVQVFKEAAIEKLRLEAEAAESRRVAQIDRERVEAEKAVAAKQQAQVVENIASGLNKLAAGDLLQRIDEPFAQEYEGLRRDFNEAVVQLQQTIKDVSASSGTIQSGTGEISTASDDLSRRTEQQAANLEETAAALAEITGAMKRSAEGAQHAREVVGIAQTTADKSSEVISRTVEAMTRIDQASRQISNIIGVIDEIAFQTNLLALNAGVEAARAGESGRGFAVVASEVRGLAQRCAEAAKEVKTLVRSSEEQVKAGVELVGASGTMLSQIVGQVGELRTIVTGIAASAETQAAGIGEVNIAIAQLDQVTQQNAAMAEEATAAARNLAKEGTELLRLVGHFSTGAPLAATTTAPRAVREVPPAPRAAMPMPARRVAAASGAAAAAAEDWQEF